MLMKLKWFRHLQKLKELAEKDRLAEAGGGEDRVAKQHLPRDQRRLSGGKQPSKEARRWRGEH